MRLAKLLAAALLLALFTGAAHAQAQDGAILIATNPQGTACQLQFTPGTATRMYIVFVPSGVTGGGITGAEFRVEGLPAGWTASSTPHAAANLIIGDPMWLGTNIAFSSCQGGGVPVVLFTVDVTPTTTGPATFIVREHTTPSNPAFLCPLVTLCDSPAFTKVCICGGTASTLSADCGCPNLPVPTDAATWGRIKTLYR